MTQLEFSWKLKARGAGGPYQRLIRNMRELLEVEEGALADAATLATSTSRTTFTARRSGRPFSSPRKRRPTTQGRLESNIVWIDLPGSKGSNSFVILDEDTLEDAAPYYLINEVGSGRPAVRNRHRPDGTLVPEPVQFKSQKGRYIKPGLVWADGGNAVRSSSSRFRQDQIHPAARVSIKKVEGTERSGRKRRRTAVNPLRTPRVRISRDIEPKHYIRDGAKAGNTQYSAAVRSAARSTFRRKR
jgi:hypothetical protein